ncbi:MAG TPA: CorA family divalent cation transporter [Candidatus Limnocylindrales bacterium]|nr:CorA family divalent cation transporter [Candidatus Limnocylindrales bacterium]
MDAPTAPTTAAPTAAQPVVRIVAWARGETHRLEGTEALTRILADPDARVWVDVTAHEHEAVAEVARIMQLHHLIAEDIAEQNQRAKFEEIENTIHLVMFWIAYEGAVTELEVDLVLDHRSLLTVHAPGWDPFVLTQLRGDLGHLLRRGPDFLLYAVTDGIVDGYFPVLDALDDELDALQDDVIRRPTSWTLERLFVLKKELIRLRRAVSPAREIFNQLTNRDLALVRREHVVYFRDVYDHLIRVTDELDNDRELVSGTLEVYLSTINNNLSTIMKRLTGVTVILAGIGAFAGIFGMSEAGLALANGEASGFWVVAGVIVMAAALTAIVLRRIDWI